MPRVEYAGRACERRAGESVLDALLRAGINVPYSCRAGVCTSCLMKVESGDVPPAAQRGLKDAWKAAGYFLACACIPAGDVVAAPIGEGVRTSVELVRVERASPSVLRVFLRPHSRFDFRAGQYVSVFRPDGLARSYSIASLPEDGVIELHVRLLPGGQMSGWLAAVAPGTLLEIQGPSGECFYVPGKPEQPLLLVGTGTGLAPLVGVLRTALAHDHRGEISLYHGAATTAGLYLQDQLSSLAADKRVRYTPSALDTDGPIDALVSSHHVQMAGWRAFLCGDPVIVQRLRKTLFLSGAALQDIHADAFLPSAASPAVAATDRCN